MTPAVSHRKRVALAGNPNTGKTSLFNRLTGLHLKVGNYPGITVECVLGDLRLSGREVAEALDVPGTYSLSARSREEQIAIQAIAGLHPLERPDLVLVVADSTQLARNLYLVLQIIEIDLPVVVALNMIDMLEERGLTIDEAAMQREMGVPVVSVSARTGQGIERLRQKIAAVLAQPQRGRPGPRWIPGGAALIEDVAAVAESLPESWHRGERLRRDALALWALLSLEEGDELRGIPPGVREAVIDRRERAHGAGRRIGDEIITGRYGWIDEHVPRFLRQSGEARTTLTDRVDRVLLHPTLGFLSFLLAMGILFQSLFSWADPAIGLVERAFGALKGWVEGALPAAWYTDLLANGIIEGVGSVLVFLPQILLLFFFIGVMEDSGYMARVAFLMDRIMRAVGLHGRAFVPMLSGFACAIPAIMATRTMERRRDRMLTMMVVPLMTCSARLPVYTVIIAALFPPDRLLGFLPVQGLLMVGMYLFSTLVALLAAAVLGRVAFPGPRVPLILEMPPYRMPYVGSVLRMMWQRSKLFVTQAGTVILVCTIGMWLLLSFPRSAEVETAHDALRAEAAAASLSDEALEKRGAEIDARQAQAHLHQSFGGRLGRAIEPVIEPLGFDWKIGVGLIGAFAAREVFVSTMGVVYGLGEEAGEEPVGLRERLRTESRADGRRVYTPLVGLSLMIFFALAAQCMSTLAVIRRETSSWRWPAFLFAYMTGLAWVTSFGVFQVGRLLGF